MTFVYYIFSFCFVIYQLVIKLVKKKIQVDDIQFLEGERMGDETPFKVYNNILLCF